jgi:hypothetical protein
MATKRRTAAEKLAEQHHQELLAAIDKMTDEMVECRDIQHSYRKWATRWLAQEREYERQLKCLRCGTIRVQRVSERGYLLGSSYEYAEGYLVKGLGRLDQDDRGAIRLQSVLGDLERSHADAG